MASPVVDEGLMEHLLRTPPGAVADAVGRLQYGAIMLIMDAFDRKVTRKSFADILEKSASLIDGAGRLGAFTAATASENFHNEHIVEGTKVKLNSEISGRAQACVKLVEVLRQCPHDEDLIS
jgi:hypothetical protein